MPHLRPFEVTGKFGRVGFRTVMRDLKFPLFAAAWLVSIATSAIAEPFCKTPTERDVRSETILPYLWNTGQYEVEVTVPQVSISVAYGQDISCNHMCNIL